MGINKLKLQINGTSGIILDKLIAYYRSHQLMTKKEFEDIYIETLKEVLKD